MIFPRRALSASPSAPGTGSSNPSSSRGESGANHGLRGDVRHWVCRAAQALGPTRSHCRRASRLYTGASRLRQISGRGLSSFRTYPARLSAGYRGFRSGENESSFGKRPRFPDGVGFSPNASDKRAPGSPQPGAVLLQICCADRMCWCAGNARAARCADKPNAGLSCRQPCLHGHGLRGIRADRRTLPRPDRRHRLRASRYSRRRLHVRLSARARPRGGRSASPACPGGNRHLPRPPVRYQDKPVPMSVRGPYSMPIWGSDACRLTSLGSYDRQAGRIQVLKACAWAKMSP